VWITPDPNRFQEANRNGSRGDAHAPDPDDDDEDEA
jgi:hypothetical protein